MCVAGSKSEQEGVVQLQVSNREPMSPHILIFVCLQTPQTICCDFTTSTVFIALVNDTIGTIEFGRWHGNIGIRLLHRNKHKHLMSLLQVPYHICKSVGCHKSLFGLHFSVLPVKILLESECTENNITFHCKLFNTTSSSINFTIS